MFKYRDASALVIYLSDETRWCTIAGENLVKEPTGFTFSDFCNGHQSHFRSVFDRNCLHAPSKTAFSTIFTRNLTRTTKPDAFQCIPR